MILIIKKHIVCIVMDLRNEQHSTVDLWLVKSDFSDMCKALIGSPFTNLTGFIGLLSLSTPCNHLVK